LTEDNQPDESPDFKEALARVQAAIAESEADEEKRKHHFGYIETSAGNL
jgi:hypothetical protein